VDGNRANRAKEIQWFHISKELKRVGISERLIQTLPKQQTQDEEMSSSIMNNNTNKNKVSFVSETVQYCGNDDDADAQSDNIIITQKERKSKALVDTKTLHTQIDETQHPHAPLPTVLSRLIHDRSRGRHQVHNAYHRIMALIGELKTEIGNFSASSEVTSTLEAVSELPELIEATEKDIAKLKVVSEILQAACAIATACPNFFFGFTAKAWEKKLLDQFVKK
jgi:hypothetical protein